MAVTSQEDIRLVDRCQAGDLEAFNQLVLKYQDRVFDTIYRMVADYEDARDLAQDCFARAFAALGEFRGQSCFYTWLFRIALNVALSHRRRQSRAGRVIVSRYETPEDLDMAGALDTNEPHRPIEQAEDRAAVAEALRCLPAEHRAIIILRDIDGANYDQIAEILRIARGTVKSRIHRARQRLREELKRVMR